MTEKIKKYLIFLTDDEIQENDIILSSIKISSYKSSNLVSHTLCLIDRKPSLIFDKRLYIYYKNSRAIFNNSLTNINEFLESIEKQKEHLFCQELLFTETELMYLKLLL